MNEMEKSNIGFKSLATYGVIFYIVAYFIAIIVKSIYNQLGLSLDNQTNYSNASNWVNFIIYIILFVALIIFNKNLLIDDFKELKKYKFSAILLKILGGFFIFYTLSFITSLLVSQIEQYASFAHNVLGRHDGFNTTSDNQAYIEEVLKGNTWLIMFVSAAFFGPICEEIVFRKSIFAVCKNKELAILLSSTIFGLIHVISSIGLYSPLELCIMLAPYIAAGLGLVIVYQKNDYNIYLPIAVHIISNTISLISILIMR